MKYTLIEAIGIKTFVEGVNHKLDQGWTLVGEFQFREITIGTVSAIWFYQATSYSFTKDENVN